VVAWAPLAVAGAGEAVGTADCWARNDSRSWSWLAGVFSLRRPYSCRRACLSRTSREELASRSWPNRPNNISMACSPRPSISSCSM